MEVDKQSISKALIKKATGLSVDEVVEEYTQNPEDDSLRLVKRKVTTKQLPPDIQAVRTLLEFCDDKNLNEFSKLTDDELLKERERLLDILKNNKAEDNSNDSGEMQEKNEV